MSSNTNPNPFLDPREPINIAALYSADGITPVQRTLQIHLRNLYCSLFPLAGAAEIALGHVSVSYCHTINADFDVSIPVFLIPHSTVCVTATAPGTTLEEFCEQQAGAYETFMAKNAPPTAQARLRFALAVMMGTKETDRPLFEIDNAYLSLGDISAAN